MPTRVEVYEGMVELERAIVAALNAHALGERNAQTQDELAGWVTLSLGHKVSARETRLVIHTLRTIYNAPIASRYSSGGGYYVPQGADEFQRYVDSLEGHFLQMGEQLAAVKKAMARTFPQTSLIPGL
ncbi:MAG: hypothetical protein HZB29_09930 [Nitrospinae bacterium]|nr:hypothetical protein [Nitrospinota bacterium]